jgi:hypothetical protein
MRKPYPRDLSDEEWKYIEPHMPTPSGYGDDPGFTALERS